MEALTFLLLLRIEWFIKYNIGGFKNGKNTFRKNERIIKVPSLEELHTELKKYGIIYEGRKMLGEISLYRKITRLYGW